MVRAQCGRETTMAGIRTIVHHRGPPSVHHTVNISACGSRIGMLQLTLVHIINHGV